MTNVVTTGGEIMVLDFFLKWGLGIVTGALASLFTIFRKEIKEFIGYKKKKNKQEFLKDVDHDLETLENKMQLHEKEVSNEIHHHDQLYFQKLEELEKRIMAVLGPIREATLSSHYNSLLEKCKGYIRKGEITADELDLLEKDYKTYSDLGGNGHMELWMTRVRQLPVK